MRRGVTVKDPGSVGRMARRFWVVVEYVRGDNLKVIASRWGLTTSEVSRIAYEEGAPPRFKTRRPRVIWGSPRPLRNGKEDTL